MHRNNSEMEIRFVRNDSTASAKFQCEGTADVVNLAAMMRNNVVVFQSAPLVYDPFPVKAPDRPKTQDR